MESFTNSRVVDAPHDLRSNFESEIEIVSDFLRRTSTMETIVKDYYLSQELLLGLQDSKVGLYSTFHESSVFRRGYDHPTTVRLAYM